MIANTTTLVVASYWMPVLAAKILAIGASFIINFLLSHLVVFRKRGGRPEPRPNESTDSGEAYGKNKTS